MLRHHPYGSSIRSGFPHSEAMADNPPPRGSEEYMEYLRFQISKELRKQGMERLEAYLALLHSDSFQQEHAETLPGDAKHPSQPLGERGQNVRSDKRDQVPRMAQKLPPHIQQVMIENMEQLVDKIDVKNTVLLDKLMAKRVLRPREAAELSELRPRSQVRQLLEVICTGTLEMYEQFTKSLYETGQGHVVQRFLSPKKGPENQQKILTRH